MNFRDYLDSLIVRLKTLRKDDKATPFFDQMSGAFIWSDEKVDGVTVEEMGCMRAINRYRTSLIVQESDLRFQSLWEEFRAKYPDWIGFDPVRCSPNRDLQFRYKEIRNNPEI
jgi:hypothetical protein